MLVLGGSTDVTTYFSLRLLTTGAEATGLTITDLDLQYVRSGVAPAAKVDATALAATDSVHSDNKAIEIDATDQPGLYRIDWPDAAFAAGVREVILSVKHTSCFTEHLRVELATAVPSVAQIAAAVWTDLLAGGDFGIATSIGKLLRDDIDATVSSRLASVGYAVPLDAAGTRSAVGLASANLDTQLAAIAAGGGGGGSDPLESLVPGDYPAGSAGEALGRMNSLGGATVEFVSVNYGDGSTLTLIRGDDYLELDGRSLEWSNAGGTWPDLTGAAIYFVANDQITGTGTVITPAGSNQKVRVELTAAETLALPEPSQYFLVSAYAVYAVLGNGDTITLARGQYNAQERT